METNETYSTRDALLDVARTRVAAAEKALPTTPLIRWSVPVIAVALAIGSLANVVDGAPWLSLIPMLVSIGVALAAAARMQKEGTYSGFGLLWRKFPAGLVLLVVGLLVAVASLPLHDIFDWSPWVVVATFAGYAALIVVLNEQVMRIGRRDLALARANLADLERS